MALFKKRQLGKLIAQATSFDEDARERAQRQLVELGSEVVAPVAAAIPDAAPMGRHLGNVIAEIGGEAALDALVSLLDHPEEETRKVAVSSLHKLGDPRAVEPLIAVLRNDASYNARCDAATALGRLGDPRAVEPLIAALGKDVWYRFAVAEALGQLGDPSAMPALTAALAGGSADERIFGALSSLGWQPASSDDRIAMSLAEENWDALAR